MDRNQKRALLLGAARDAATTGDWKTLVTVAERVLRFEQLETLRYTVSCDLAYLASQHGVLTPEDAREAVRPVPKPKPSGRERGRG